MKDFPVMVRLPAGLKEPLEQQAQLLGIGVATLVRMILLSALQKKAIVDWRIDGAA